MRKSMTLALAGAAAISLGLGGCSKAADKGGADADSIKQAIKADEAKWNKDVKAKDTEALAGHYADDAYFVPPGAPAADGSTAIRQFYATALTDPVIEVQIASDKVDVAASGDFAYSRGHYTEKYTDKKTAKVMTASGTYLAVYKKQDDGSWKIVQDFAAADPDSIKAVPPEKPATRAKMVSF
ncbi:MAG TPA: SgcJ/EcaC family oxidoreductase [Sphingomicrobium sp.]